MNGYNILAAIRGRARFKDHARLIAAVEAGWRTADEFIKATPAASHEAHVARVIRSAIINALEEEME